jgi:hypothetical protein
MMRIIIVLADADGIHVVVLLVVVGGVGVEEWRSRKTKIITKNHYYY